MAKNDELSFIDLVDESKSVSSIQDEKDQRLTAAEENIDNIAEIVNENSKVTNRLAAKIDRISKTLSKPRIKKLFENATPLNKMVDKQKQESKGKQVNDKATKVGNLEGQDGMLEILNKILQFMQKTYDEDKLALEKERNFAEENALEKSKKHQEMLEALGGDKKKKEKATKAEKEDDEGFLGMIGKLAKSILTALGLGGILSFIETAGKFILSLMKTLGSIAGMTLEQLAKTLVSVGRFFFLNPLGIALLAGTGVALIGSWVYNKIKEDPQGALAGKGGIGMAVAGLGSEGQLPSWDEEQKQKNQEKMAEQANKKGITGASLQELEAQRQQLIDTGDPRSWVRKGKGDDRDKAKAKKLDDIEAEIAKRKTPAQATTTTTPSASPAPSAPAATPEPTTPSTAQVNTASAENAQAKIDEMMSGLKQQIDSATTNVSSTIKDRSLKPILPVRNQEETFKRMIMNNTRIV